MDFSPARDPGRFGQLLPMLRMELLELLGPARSAWGPLEAISPVNITPPKASSLQIGPKGPKADVQTTKSRNIGNPAPAIFSRSFPTSSCPFVCGGFMKKGEFPLDGSGVF